MRTGPPSTLQLVVPMAHRSGVLSKLHNSPTGGHLGVDKVMNRLKQRYYWPGFSSDVRQWCATCRSCAVRKTMSPHPRAPLSTISAAEPMQIVSVDILGLGNRYILVAMDYFTKWAEAYPVPNQEAATIANKLVN